ncbi:putative C6 transcription factor [Thozetella sp. PMI_491]|nr:putative C6 transcription factor [Thozetella sp. PMI_491]
MNDPDVSKSPKNTATRVSLACIPCRTRHVRCDARQPTCVRCSGEGRQCQWTKSRRGGLDRAALAARRAQLEADAPRDNHRPKPLAAASERHSQDRPSSSSPSQTFTSPVTAGQGLEFEPRNMPDQIQTRCAEILSDSLIDAYYSCFHGFHPFVLPRRHLESFHRTLGEKGRMEPLLLVMRLMGALYTQSAQVATLKDETVRVADQTLHSPPDPFLVQFRLLYAIILFWSDDNPRARENMDAAIRMSVELDMFRQQFATQHGDGSSVLEESWRRTWWQIYIVDAFWAATTHSFVFQTSGIEATVDLPCEEEDYEAGTIPAPRTLEDFSMREFSSDESHFSSFAYLIGAVRGVALLVENISPTAIDGPPQQVLEELDAVADGWLLLLPEPKKGALSKGGEIDELMFQAHMALHAAVIGLHRPFSELLFNPVECISSCATPAPTARLPQESRALHTMRCLRSIESQVRLLALPARSFCHSPFAVCMIATGTIPLLSACKFLFSGKRLVLGRDQIRLTIGCLKSLALVWQRGARVLRENQAIAREVFSIAPKTQGKGSCDSADTINSREIRAPGSDKLTFSDMTESSSDYSMTLSLAEDSLPCWNLNDAYSDLSTWFPLGSG